MPDAPARPCLYPAGCAEYAVRDGRCEEHARQNVRQRDERRGKTAERLYDAVWKRFRLWFLHRHPICADCQRKPAVDVHHKKKLRDYPALRLVESNCLGLCHECHAARTARGE